MSKPIALQLYSIRDALNADFAGSLRRVAELGYAGVEFAGVYGESPTSAAALCAELGLQVIGAHLPLPLGEQQEYVLDTAAELGITRLFCPWMPPDRFATADSIRVVCDEINAANDVARARGLQLGYHNHDAEFRAADDGVLAFEHMKRLLDPAVLFEIDIFWVQFAGLDPAPIVRELGERTPVLHVKDGGENYGDPMRKYGEGIVDIPAVVRAAEAAEWLVVELDTYDGDVFEAVAYNFNFLVEQGLGHGR